MGRIHQDEERIMSRWTGMARANDDAEQLVTDGLLFRGEIYWKDGCWHRSQGNEEELWENAPRKLLILTKDLNDDEAWDIRQETGRLNTMIFSYERAIPFYKNLRMWCYGLLNASAEDYPPFREARDMKISGPFYEIAPLARVNCKKQVGEGSISDIAFMQYMEAYAEPLKAQIALYDADVILCCGSSRGRNLTMDFVKSQYLTDLTPVRGTDNWIYLSPSAEKVVVNSYHPSARIGYEDTYEDMMRAFCIGMSEIKGKYGFVLK